MATENSPDSLQSLLETSSGNRSNTRSPSRLLSTASDRRPDWYSNLERRNREHNRLIDAARLFRDSGVPKIHREGIERCFVDGPWLEAFEKLRGESGLIILIGPRGTGKTQLAAALLRSECEGMEGENAREVRYFGSPDDLSAFIRAACADGGEGEEKIMRRICGWPALCIDELAIQAETDFMSRVLTRIIDRRYGARWLTILIANATRQQFAMLVGQSIVSRMHEVGTVVECDWPSWRKQ